MALTATSFVGTLGGLTVTGVKKKYAFPPSQLDTAHMPCQFVRLPDSTTPIGTFSGAPQLDTVTAEIVIVIEPWAQSTNATSFALMLTMIDNLTAALKAEMAANQQINTWTISSRPTDVGTNEYWSLVATVEGSE
jgi:hypothetical protein